MGRARSKPDSLPADDGATPLYRQVAHILRTKIVDGDEAHPVRLPADSQLCTIHQVSLITIRKAMDLLSREGLVERAPGRGTLTVPQAIRQWKRTRQGRLIHVLTSWQDPADVPSSYYGQIYQGIFERAEQLGYRLSIQRLGVTRTGLSRRLQLPDRSQTAGIVFVGMMNEPTIRLYTDADYAVVCADYYTTNPRADAVVIDCYGEGQMAAEFLLRQGHRNLFYLGNAFVRRAGAQRESDAELLLAGLQRGLVLAGLPPIDPERIRFCGDQPADTPAAVEWFLSLRPRPTAGAVFSKGVCERFRQQLHDRQVRCPEDVSLITKAWDSEPTDMTCLYGEARLVGQLAVDALLERASGRRTACLRMATASRLDRGRTVRQLAKPFDQALEQP